jgi:hypothetical protein
MLFNRAPADELASRRPSSLCVKGSELRALNREGARKAGWFDGSRPALFVGCGAVNTGERTEVSVRRLDLVSLEELKKLATGSAETVMVKRILGRMAS